MDWVKLIEVTKGKEIVVERIRIAESGIRIEGEFELPTFAKLSLEDQVFVAAFIKSHGSIKEMERLFGVSYPSIKNRLNQISKHFEFLDIQVSPEVESSSKKEILDQLSAGKISVEQALKELKK